LGVGQDRGQEEDLGTDVRGARGEEIGRGEVAACAVFAGEVEAMLVGRESGEEVGGVGESLHVEELRHDGGVAGFDVGVGAGMGGRIEAVGGTTAVRALRNPSSR
jgi:hypothetical protein